MAEVRACQTQPDEATRRKQRQCSPALGAGPVQGADGNTRDRGFRRESQATACAEPMLCYRYDTSYACFTVQHRAFPVDLCESITSPTQVKVIIIQP